MCTMSNICSRTNTHTYARRSVVCLLWLLGRRRGPHNNVSKCHEWWMDWWQSECMKNIEAGCFSCVCCCYFYNINSLIGMIYTNTSGNVAKNIYLSKWSERNEMERNEMRWGNDGKWWQKYVSEKLPMPGQFNFEANKSTAHESTHILRRNLRNKRNEYLRFTRRIDSSPEQKNLFCS